MSITGSNVSVTHVPPILLERQGWVTAREIARSIKRPGVGLKTPEGIQQMLNAAVVRGVLDMRRQQVYNARKRVHEWMPEYQLTEAGRRALDENPLETYFGIRRPSASAVS